MTSATPTDTSSSRSPARKRLIVFGAIGFVLLTVVMTIGYEMFSSPGRRIRQVKVDPAVAAGASPNRYYNSGAPPIPAKPLDQWWPKFKSVYELAEGENLKRVPKPFIPERIEYYRAKMHPSQVQAIPQGPDFYALTYDGTDFTMITAWFGQPDVRGLFGSVLGIERELLLGPAEVLNK